MILLSYAFSYCYVIICLSYFAAASNKFIHIVLPSHKLIKFHYQFKLVSCTCQISSAYVFKNEL